MLISVETELDLCWNVMRYSLVRGKPRCFRLEKFCPEDCGSISYESSASFFRNPWLHIEGDKSKCLPSGLKYRQCLPSGFKYRQCLPSGLKYRQCQSLLDAFHYASSSSLFEIYFIYFITCSLPYKNLRTLTLGL